MAKKRKTKTKSAAKKGAKKTKRRKMKSMTASHGPADVEQR